MRILRVMQNPEIKYTAKIQIPSGIIAPKIDFQKTIVIFWFFLVFF